VTSGSRQINNKLCSLVYSTQYINRLLRRLALVYNGPSHLCGILTQEDIPADDLAVRVHQDSTSQVLGASRRIYGGMRLFCFSVEC
jgi:hypothetical protein